MNTSKSKATQTDCRGLLVYITLLCDCTRITCTLAFEGDLQNATACASRGKGGWGGVGGGVMFDV